VPQFQVFVRRFPIAEEIRSTSRPAVRSQQGALCSGAWRRKVNQLFRFRDSQPEPQHRSGRGSWAGTHVDQRPSIGPGRAPLRLRVQFPIRRRAKAESTLSAILHRPPGGWPETAGSFSSVGHRDGLPEDKHQQRIHLIATRTPTASYLPGTFAFLPVPGTGHNFVSRLLEVQKAYYFFRRGRQTRAGYSGSSDHPQFPRNENIIFRRAAPGQEHYDGGDLDLEPLDDVYWAHTGRDFDRHSDRQAASRLPGGRVEHKHAMAVTLATRIYDYPNTSFQQTQSTPDSMGLYPADRRAAQRRDQRAETNAWAVHQGMFKVTGSGSAEDIAKTGTLIIRSCLFAHGGYSSGDTRSCKVPFRGISSKRISVPPRTPPQTADSGIRGPRCSGGGQGRRKMLRSRTAAMHLSISLGSRRKVDEDEMMLGAWRNGRRTGAHRRQLEGHVSPTSARRVLVSGFMEEAVRISDRGERAVYNTNLTIPHAETARQQAQASSRDRYGSRVVMDGTLAASTCRSTQPRPHIRCCKIRKKHQGVHSRTSAYSCGSYPTSARKSRTPKGPQLSVDRGRLDGASR